MTNKPFDEQFDLAFDQAASNIDGVPPLDYGAAWNKTRQTIHRLQQRRERFKKFRLFTTMAASILLGAALFSLPMLTTALDPVKEAYQLKNNSDIDGVHQSNGVFSDGTPHGPYLNGMKTPPPPGYEPDPNLGTPDAPLDPEPILEESGTGWPTWEDFEENITDFPVRSIKYLPKGYELDALFTYSSNYGTYKVSGEYKKSETEWLYIVINQKLGSFEHKPTIMGMDFELEVRNIAGGKASIFELETGSLQIDMVKDHLIIHLFGPITKEEGIKVLESLVIVD